MCPAWNAKTSLDPILLLLSPEAKLQEGEAQSKIQLKKHSELPQCGLVMFSSLL